MKFVVGNFKSNKTRTEYESWIDIFEQYSAGFPPDVIRVVLCPSSPSLMFVSNRLLDRQKHPSTYVGIQDISPYPAGAYTGAVSNRNVDGFHVHYAIVGHSERRSHFHETNSDVANKVREAITAQITPIVCVTASTVLSQANAIDAEYRNKVIVAFEPIEHIGTGETDTMDHILEVKKAVVSSFGAVHYLYGGSVDTHTDTNLLRHPEIDGFLVGSATLDASQFVELIQRIGPHSHF